MGEALSALAFVLKAPPPGILSPPGGSGGAAGGVTAAVAAAAALDASAPFSAVFEGGEADADWSRCSDAGVGLEA